MGSNPVSSSRFKTAKPSPRMLGEDSPPVLRRRLLIAKPVLVTGAREAFRRRVL
jgi:hypothetical protein